MKELASTFRLEGTLVRELKYGENAWQTPAGLYSFGTDDPLAIDKLVQVDNGSPGYCNVCDLDRSLQTLTHIAAGFDVNFNYVPCIASGVKHGNPCGTGVSNDRFKAIEKMLDGDPRAIMGGTLMFNFDIDAEAANHIVHYGKRGKARWWFNVITAASFTTEAVEILDWREGDPCRFWVNPALSKLDKTSLDQAERFRQVRGGMMEQPNYTFILDLTNEKFVGLDGLDDAARKDIVFAWAIGSTSNSNTITCVKDGMLIGNGVGQMDRVGASELAILRAAGADHVTVGAVAYSDSFFPFIDGPEELLGAGVSTIFSTSGSKRDDDVIKFCKEHDIRLVQLPDSEARGFFGH